MTYTELVAALQGWLRRPEAEQTIPMFVALAEAQINRRLAEAGIVGAEVRAAATVSGQYVAAPGDMARPVKLTLSTGDLVESATAESVAAFHAASPTSTGKPRYFALLGGELLFYPAPDLTYTAELIYQAKAAALSPTVATNWILASHPDVYLYGALVQAGPYLDDEPRLKTWADLYASGLADMIEAERNKRGSRNTPAFRADLPLARQTFNISTGA